MLKQKQGITTSTVNHYRYKLIIYRKKREEIVCFSTCEYELSKHENNSEVESAKVKKIWNSLLNRVWN